MEKEKPAKLVDSKRSWFLLAIAFLSLFGVGGLQMSFGTILTALVQEFGESKSKTAWVGSLVTFFSFVLSPLTISLSQRHGIRVTQFIGGIFITVAIITTSLVSSIDYMFVTYGVLLGIGTALVNAPAFAIIPELFDKHIAIAMGISSSGNALGLVFFSFVLPKLLSGLGWRKTLWIVAALGPLISIFGLAFPGAHVEPGTTKVEVKGCDVTTVELRQPWWKCMKKKAFVLWSAVIITFGLVQLVPLYLLPICAQEAGIPAAHTEWLNIIYGILCFLGKLSSGSLAKPLLKRDLCKYMYVAVLFIHSLSSFIVSLNSNFQWLAIYMALIGFLDGVSASLFYIVTLEIVGIANFPAVCGLVLSLCGISTIGPPLAGILYENFPKIHYLLLAISATSFTATVLMAIIPCVTPRRLYTLHQGYYDYWRVYCNNPNVSPRPPRQARPFTVEDAKRDIRQQLHQSKLHLKKDVPTTVSQTCLVEAEEAHAAG